MHQCAHLARVDEQVLAAIFRHQKTETIRMGDHPAAHQVQLACRRITPAAVEDQLAVTHHGPQAATQRLTPLVVVQTQASLELVLAHRPALLLEKLQNVFATGDGLFVGPGLSLGVGIIDNR